MRLCQSRVETDAAVVEEDALLPVAKLIAHRTHEQQQVGAVGCNLVGLCIGGEEGISSSWCRMHCTPS